MESITKRAAASPEALHNHERQFLREISKMEVRDRKIKTYLEKIHAKIIKDDTGGILKLLEKAIEKTDVVAGSLPKMRKEIDDFIKCTYVTSPYKNMFKKKQGMQTFANHNVSKGIIFSYFSSEFNFLNCCNKIF